MADENKTVDVFTLPEGMVINSSLFVKDKYNEQSVANYKIELAIVDGEEMIELENKLFDFAVDYWGAGADEDPDLRLPIKNGDKMAAARERKGKEGDAYKSKLVIRANTTFNLHGDDDAGGIQVLDENADAMLPARKSEIFNGCSGIAAVTISAYTATERDKDGDNVEIRGLKFYLAAFQKTKGGERLGGSSDRSNLFKPVGRERSSSGEPSRRRRAGTR